MPILNPNSMEFISRGIDQTLRIGMRLGAIIRPGDSICLEGELGAGKTTLMKGIAAGWGSLDLVTSPTFVLVNRYSRPDGTTLYHMDGYRLNAVEAAVDLDIDSMLDSSPLVIEWADNIVDVIPDDNLWISFRSIYETQRDIVFTPHGERYLQLIKELRTLVYGQT